jgi:hypothetical protein
VRFFGYPHDAWAKELPEPFGHDYQWYGGYCFDLIATFPAAPNTITQYNYKLNENMTENKFSVGDHRYVGYYTAEELLKQESNNVL